MVGPIVVLILGQQTKPSDYLDRCLKAHRALQAVDVTIRSNTATSNPNKPGVYRLVFVRPNQVQLHAQVPADKGKAATDLRFAVVGNKLIGYDALADEKLSRTTSSKGSLADKLTTIFGPLNDAVQAVVEPERLSGIIEDFRPITTWSVSKEGGDVILSHRSNAKSGAMWRIDSKTMLVKRLTILAPTGKMDWTYTYHPKPRTAAFTPPASAYPVDQFSEKPPSAKYADAKAKTIARDALRAIDRMKSAVFTLTNGEGTSKVWYSGGKVREELKNRSWAYDGTYLTGVMDSAKRHYRSKVGRLTAIDALGDTFMRATPFVRVLLQRKNPLNALLWETNTVKFAGSITIGGVKCDLLESRGQGIRHLLTLRSDNHLPLILRTENKVTDSGESITSELKFSYESVDRPIPSGMFSLGIKKGYKSGPFPIRKVR